MMPIGRTNTRAEGVEQYREAMRDVPGDGQMVFELLIAHHTCSPAAADICHNVAEHAAQARQNALLFAQL